MKHFLIRYEGKNQKEQFHIIPVAKDALNALKQFKNELGDKEGPLRILEIKELSGEMALYVKNTKLIQSLGGEMEKEGKCCFCGKEYSLYGNDPRPIVTNDKEGRCCDECNARIVIPTRISIWRDTPRYDFYGLLDKESGHLINSYGLPYDGKSNVMEEQPLLFTSEADAQHHANIDHLFNVDIVHIELRKFI